MSFIEEIADYRSVSIVGLAKNAGKTETLNYILKKVHDGGKRLAVTSIGIDGESQDQVTQTAKPEIEIYEGMIFVTSEKHYREKRLIAEVLDVDSQQTSLGRLVTARAITSGKVILSGPASTHGLRDYIEKMKRWQVDTTFIDGALSRLSLGSPAVTEAMVLATGAAVSRNIAELVKRTKYTYDLTQSEAVNPALAERLAGIETGVWGIDPQGEAHDLRIPSVLMLENHKEELFRYGHTIFVAGIVTDKLLQYLRVQKQAKEIVLIAKDFTRIFASPEVYYAFLKKGARIRVVWRNKLLGITINPTSPEGYRMNPEELKDNLESALRIPVYNVRQCN